MVADSWCGDDRLSPPGAPLTRADTLALAVRPQPDRRPTLEHFQLVMVDGEALGAVELSRPDWPPGSNIYRGPDETNLRVSTTCRAMTRRS
jgi:hypothetical protein